MKWLMANRLSSIPWAMMLNSTLTWWKSTQQTSWWWTLCPSRWSDDKGFTRHQEPATLTVLLTFAYWTTPFLGQMPTASYVQTKQAESEPSVCIWQLVDGNSLFAGSPMRLNGYLWRTWRKAIKSKLLSLRLLVEFRRSLPEHGGFLTLMAILYGLML